MLSVATAALSFSPLTPLSKARAPAPCMESKEFCYGLPGNMPPAGNFDPANFLGDLSKGEVYRLREAELAHCRVGMLASAGFFVQEYFHPLFTADGGPAIKQIPALPPVMWFLMTLGIGVCEAARIQKGWANPYEPGPTGQPMENVQALKPDYYPGDLGFDPLGLKPSDPKELKKMQEKEIANGRLGMLAAAGFLAQEAATGKTWGACDTSFAKLLFGGEAAAKATELARDSMPY